MGGEREGDGEGDRELQQGQAIKTQRTWALKRSNIECSKRWHPHRGSIEGAKNTAVALVPSLLWLAPG